jgi:hypothetical protein
MMTVMLIFAAVFMVRRLLRRGPRMMGPWGHWHRGRLGPNGWGWYSGDQGSWSGGGWGRAGGWGGPVAGPGAELNGPGAAPSQPVAPRAETPLESLQRRFAAGEMDIDQYEREVGKLYGVKDG